jgi:outer membrane murein-binding lipoprotein Lpp
MMLSCPYCNQELEVAVSRQESAFWRRNLTPGLGCGSMIAIAVIVAMFSRGNSDDIERLSREVQHLNASVTALDQKLTTLTTSVDKLGKQPGNR